MLVSIDSGWFLPPISRLAVSMPGIHRLKSSSLVHEIAQARQLSLCQLQSIDIEVLESLMNRLIQDVALRTPVSAAPEHSISEAEERLLSRDEAVLFVIDAQERLLGQVTDLDLFQYRLMGGDGGARISTLMSPISTSIDFHSPIEQACEILKQRDCLTIPVLAGDRLIGQLSRRSLIPIIPTLNANQSNHLIAPQIPQPAFLKYARSQPAARSAKAAE